MTAVGRRQSRRTALFLLYQWDVTGQPLGSLYEGEPDEFAAGLAGAVDDLAQIAEIAKEIEAEVQRARQAADAGA